MRRISFPATLLVLTVALSGLAGCSGNRSANTSGNSEPASDTSSASSPEEIENDKEASEASSKADANKQKESSDMATLLYQGHGSLRITTKERNVIYIDPYAGEGYDAPADLILVTHAHQDHTAIDKIGTQNPGCETINYKEALENGEHKTFELDYVTVEAVQAGNNPNHDIRECVGYILTLNDGKTIYASGDTSTTEQMATLAERGLDYAFFCCDGRYNMDIAEAVSCANLVGAKHSIPYHMAPGELFSMERAEQFDAENRMIVPAGETFVIE